MENQFSSVFQNGLIFPYCYLFYCAVFTRHVVAMGAGEANRRHTKAKDYVLE